MTQEAEVLATAHAIGTVIGYVLIIAYAAWVSYWVIRAVSGDDP